MGTDATVAAAAIGVYHLYFSSQKLIILEDCLFVPQIRKSLISISKLVCSGYSFLFNSKLSIRYNNKFVAYVSLSGGLYILDCLKEENNCVEMNEPNSVKSNKRKQDINPTYLWHLRLGHANIDRINRLVKNGPLKSLTIDPYPICESCLQGKMTKKPFYG